MKNADLLNSLRRLGLNQYEAQAYLTLSTLGEKTAGELSEQAELPRPRVYDVLSKLQDKGFVALQPGRPVKYAALPIMEAVRTLKKQKELSLTDEIGQVEELGKEISGKMKNIAMTERYGIEENVWTLKGRDAIYSKIAGMIANARDHITLSTTQEGIARKMKAHLKELEKASTRGVKVNIVSPINQKELASKMGDLAKLVSHSPKELPTRMFLADNEALLFLTDEKTPGEDEVGVWIRSPHLVKTFKHAFGTQEK
ncbi:TrmB family transcriptional regulator [Candidatus Micrarchaeota archaeon]|nr:TrmB family transcriptional regulator [Candidatus Micrarchaeota archaeon]